MIKTFTMEVTFDTETNNMQTSTRNNGFSGLEIAGLFATKQQDILNQIVHQSDFDRKVQNGNGLWETIANKGDE